MSGPRPSHATSADYRAAIAQWRLALRTEVKRCSSLPSSMFDACDPALETHLAATAEAVLLSLLGTAAPEPGPTQELAPGETRREHVAADEMRRLPCLAATGELDPPDFESGLDEEYLAILEDVCSTAEGEPRLMALELLGRDFGRRPPADGGEPRA